MKKTTEEITETVIKLVQEQMGIDDGDKILTKESVLDDLGFDSLDLVELVMYAEEEFDIYIEDSEAEIWKTIGDVVACVEGKLR